MKNFRLKFVAPLALTVMLSACGGPTGNTTTTASNDGSSVDGALLGALLNGATGSNAGSTVNSAVNAGSLISGLIGQLTNSAATANSIVGTWVYSEPTVQFESENFLAQAGGIAASQAIVKKITPYYQKLGITAGKAKYTFNKDNTCTYTLGKQTFQGTYVFDPKAHTLTITNQLGMRVLNAYATVTANELAVTLDSSKLLTFLQSAANASGNANLTTLGTLSQSFKGMKTGFLLRKQ